MPEENNAPSYDYTTFPRQFLAYRWFKPLLVALLTLVFSLVFQMFVMGTGIAWFYAEGGGTSGDVSILGDLDNIGSSGYFTGPGALIAFGSVAMILPALALAVLIVRDRPFSSYSSSRGGFNWGAFFKCLGVGAVVYAAITAIQLIAFPDENATGVIAFTAAGFVLLAILVPIQCVAEEYAYRGLIMQTFGAWSKLPAVAIVASALLFTVSHGYNLTGLAAIFVGAVIWGVLAWQTKGIEATCAAHIMNNMIGVYTVGFGVSTVSNDTDVVSLVVAILVDVVYAAAILLLGKKFNWFTSKGDGTAKANEAYRAKMAQKQAGQPERDCPPIPYTQQSQAEWQMQGQPPIQYMQQPQAYGQMQDQPTRPENGELRAYRRI